MAAAIARATARRGGEAAAPTRRGRAARQAPAGMPGFMTVHAGGGVKARIAALQQQEQTEDRDEAEALAGRIGRDDVREVMERQDARAQAARGEPDTAGAGSDASAEAEASAAGAEGERGAATLVGAQASDFAGIESPEVGGEAAARGPSSGAEGGAASDAGATGAAEAAQDAPDERPGLQAPGRSTAPSSDELARDLDRTSEPQEPQTEAGNMQTGDLVLIDIELAEHQRWAAAEAHVGAAGSELRAEFVAEQVGSGFIGGVASGAAMGLGIGLVTRAVPVLGPIIGGGMALHGLLTRDWAAAAATIGRFGEGNDTYEVLANTLASVSAVIDLATQVLDVITGIVGVVEAVAIGVAAGAGVLAFFTFGATAGIAIAAGELAVTCEEIRQGITIVSTALTSINNLVLNPCVLLFRALYSFTSQADPREIEAGGQDLSAAGGAAGGALGGWLGGHAAQLGARARPPAEDGAPTTQRPPHELPPPATDAPDVHFTRPPAEVETLAGAGGTLAEAPGGTGVIRGGPAEPLPEVARRHPSMAEIEASPGLRVADTELAPAVTPAAPPREMQQAELPLGPVAPPPAPRRTGGRLEAPVEPLSLRAISSSDAIPRGAQEGAIGTYKVAVANPHSVALESNPPGAPGATRGGGRAPQTGFEAAGLYREHQAPAAVMGEVHPNYEYANAAGASRKGSSTREALTIALPEVVKPFKDVADARLLTEVRQRQARGEDVSGAEIIARGAHHVQDAYAQAGLPAPQQQITRQFLGEMEVMHGPRFGYEEFRPGEGPPPGRTSPLAGASDAEISQHLDNLFGPYEHPMPPPGGQMSFPGMAPRTPAGAQVPKAAAHQAPEQLPLLFPSPQMDLFAPRPGGGAGPGVPPEGGFRIADAPTRGTTPLTRPEFEAHARMAVQMGMPREQIHPAQGDTSYHPGYGALLIGADVHPLPPSQRPTGLANPANAALESHAVIGHEVIGHREAALGGQTRDEFWHEELQASARAALHTPGLSREQSWLLLQDAAARRRFQTREGEIYVDTERYGPAAEATRPRSTPRGPGDEPSVIIDPRLLVPPKSAARSESPPAAAPARPQSTTTGTRAPGGAGAASRTATAEGGPAVAAPPGGRAPGGWAARGGQLGALFLPQFFGGGSEAPAFAQQRAAHRARFTVDNQPAEGVERANPHYTAPPATPEQIIAIQNEFLNLLAVRARAEVEAEHEGDRVQACEANRAPIAASVADTRGGLSVITAHEQAIAQRDAANQAQQKRQQEAAGLTAGYPDRAAGLTALTVPLAAWEGFTSLASHLPGDAGNRMAEMNAQARQMQEAFGHMDAQMGDADGEQPAFEEGLAHDAQRIADTGEQAVDTRADLQTAADGAVALRDANEATAQAAQARQNEALQRREGLAAAALEREETAASLAEQLRAWAQQHRAERAATVAEVVQRHERAGHTITQRPAD